MHRTLIACLLLLTLSACATGQPLPTTPDRLSEQLLPTQPAPTWQEPATIINAQNAPQMRYVGRLEMPIPNSGSIFAFAFTEDGTRLAVLTPSVLVVWDLLNGQTVFYTSRLDAQSLYFSPDKTELYTLDANGTLRIYNSSAGVQTDSLEVVPSDYSGKSAYNAREGWLAVGSDDGTVRVWDLLARRALVVLTADVNDISDLAFDERGQTLALIGGRGALQVWDWQASDARVVQTLPEGSPSLGRLALSADGSRLAVGTAQDIRLFDARTGEQTALFEAGRGNSTDILRFTQDGAYLLNSGTASAMNIWNVERGTLALALAELGGEPTSIAFSLDGGVMVSSVFQRPVYLWDLQNIGAGTLPRAELPMSANIIEVGWSPDGRALVMFGADGNAHVWGIPTEPDPTASP